MGSTIHPKQNSKLFPGYVLQRGFPGGNKYDKNKWINKMLVSYFDIINNDFDAASKAAFLPVLRARLQPDYLDSAATGYLYNIFGPSGQNKTVCDFLFMLKTRLTTTPSKAIVKTGATLRWDQDGVITESNAVPAWTKTTGSGFFSCSSIDGFSAITGFRNDVLGLELNYPKLLLSGITGAFYLNNNNLTHLSEMNLPNCTSFRINVNPAMHPDLLDHNIPKAVDYLFAGSNKNKIVGYRFISLALTTLNGSANNLPTGEIDKLLNQLNIFYAANAPLVNLTVTLSGANMGIPTGGVNNTDILALMNTFTAASKVFTAIIRTS